MKKLIILLFSVAIFASCNNSNSSAPILEKSDPLPTLPGQAATTEKHAVVLEAIDGGTYTYLRLKADGIEFWAAITARPVEIGKSYYYEESVTMRDFESKQLNRTFDSILFIGYFGENPSGAAQVQQQGSTQDHTSTERKEDLSIEHSGDEISLEELFSNTEKYSGKEVMVKGKVVKINMGIMDRNWIHIQDGTNHEGLHDLTLTTQELVGYALDEVVSFKGTITLKKDFGAGYFYPVIMENAEVVKNDK